MNKELSKKIDSFKEYFCKKCSNNGAQVIEDKNFNYDISYNGRVDCVCPRCGEEFMKRVDDVTDYIDVDVDDDFENPYCCDVCRVEQFIEQLKYEL